jgi:hypothetical protein
MAIGIIPLQFPSWRRTTQAKRPSFVTDKQGSQIETAPVRSMAIVDRF